MKQMTLSWLRNYANLVKQASYQDKWQTLLAEDNPYYLLEWLLFPLAHEDAAAIAFQRSPGKLQQQYMAFTDVFIQHLIHDLVLHAFAASEADRWRFITAIQDLQNYYGLERWQQAVVAWSSQMKLSWIEIDRFQSQLKQGQSRLKKQYQEKRAELDLRFPEPGEEKQQELVQILAQHEQRMSELPRKLIRQHYDNWPLVAYTHYSEQNIKAPFDWLQQQLLVPQKLPIESLITKGDYRAFVERFTKDAIVREQCLKWTKSYFSPSLMTIEHVGIEQRQSWWIGLLQYLSENEQSAELDKLWKITFQLRGIADQIMQASEIPMVLHRLVVVSLSKPEWRKWIREMLVLRSLEIFLQALLRESYEFTALSWILCIDSQSLEHRLLRHWRRQVVTENQPASLQFVVERICRIYIDAVRSGLATQLMGPIFEYLAIHHIDFLFGWIQKAEQMEELIPILTMEKSLVKRLFAGSGVRETAARKAVLPLFLQWLSQPSNHKNDPLIRSRLSTIYESEKGLFIASWLAQQSAAAASWSNEQAMELAELLQIEWLAFPSTEENEHEQICTLLAEQSGLVQFTTDTRHARQEGLRYRIVTPGVKDALTGHVFLRVKVRGELTDTEQMTSLLDELKNL